VKRGTGRRTASRLNPKVLVSPLTDALRAAIEIMSGLRALAWFS
jgi:hypothetical protein